MQRALLTNDLNVPKPSGASFIDDPKGIAIPWEEKFPKKPKSK